MDEEAQALIDKRKKRAAYMRKWSRENPEKKSANARIDYLRHGEHIRERVRNAKLANPLKTIIGGAKYRAKKRGLPFNIDESDVSIPNVCPILGIPMEFGVGGHVYGSPSIDRIVNELGYVKGNVRIISRRANTLRTNMTPLEAEHIYLDMVRVVRPLLPN